MVKSTTLPPSLKEFNPNFPSLFGGVGSNPTAATNVAKTAL